jgi:magnesium transporter
MIHILRWTGGGRPVPVTPDDLPPAAELPADDVVWIDLADPSPAEEEWALQNFLPVHPLTLADATKPRREPGQGAHLPKAEEFADYLFVVVNPLPAWAGRPVKGTDHPGESPPHLSKVGRPQLSAVLTHRVLVTHHYDDLACVESTRAYVDKHAECGRRGPDYLFHLVLDEMVDEYAPVVERIADRLDKLEARLFARAGGPDSLHRLLHLKRRVTFLRKTLVMEREVLSRLVRGEFDLVDAREVAYYRNVYDHLVRYAELVETARETATDLMQTHLSAESHRLNEVMKVLTTISTIVLVPTLIAGVYGMNFDHMPELKWGWGYPFALGLMALSAATALAVFRWKKWI